jgi:large subunit ribosomal protein L18
MSVRFTGKNIHVQFIDDQVGRTLAATSTLSKSLPDRESLSANVAGRNIGKVAPRRLRAKGIKQVVFDRSGARYHGKVKALADALPAKQDCSSNLNLGEIVAEQTKQLSASTR